jgi:hypothetical protein
VTQPDSQSTLNPASELTILGQIGGTSQAITAHPDGDAAYFGLGTRIWGKTLMPTVGPDMWQSDADMQGLPIALATNGWTVFAVDETRLYAFDTMSLHQLDTWTIPEFMPLPRDIELVGNLLYLATSAAGEGGIYVVDVSDPMNLKLAAELPNPLEAGYMGVALDQQRQLAFATRSGGSVAELAVLDTSTITPTIVTSMTLTMMDAFHLVVSGNTLYVATSEGLVIFDVTDPSQPQQIAAVGEGTCYDLAKLSRYLFIAGDAGVDLYDVANPALPLWLSRYDMSASAISASTIDSVMIAAREHGVIQVDFSNHTAPSMVWSYNPAPFPLDVEASGNRAYLANLDDGMSTVDISMPEAMTGTLIADANYTLDVDIEGNLAAVAAGEDGVKLYNVSLFTPTLITVITPTLGAMSVNINNGYLYVGDCEYGALSTGEASLQIYDLADPRAPALLGTLPLFGELTDIEVGTIDNMTAAIVSAPWEATIGHLYVLDVSDQTDPTMLTSIEGQPLDIVLTNDRRAFVAQMNSSTVEEWDIADLSAPVLLSTIEPVGYHVRGLALNGSRLLVSGEDQAALLDVARRGRPRVIDTCLLPTRDTWGVAIRGDLGFVAGGGHGLYALQMPLFRAYLPLVFNNWPPQ